jgi:hypothetical protein
VAVRSLTTTFLTHKWQQFKGEKNRKKHIVMSHC